MTPKREEFGIDKVKFITLTNDGYIGYTLNCLKSLEKSKLVDKLDSYAIGKNAYYTLLQNGYRAHLIDDKDTEFSQFRKGNWHNITKKKFNIIHENLKKYKYVCFTDGDIVYKDKRFLSYCMNLIDDYDILIQNDTLDDNDHSNLCSGFMFIKSNRNTIKLFDPEIATKQAKEGWGDQMYINSIKKKLNYKILPLELFPNGQYYYDHPKCKPYLIHFNWIVGHEKKNKMIKHKMWYI